MLFTCCLHGSIMGCIRKEGRNNYLCSSHLGLSGIQGSHCSVDLFPSNPCVHQTLDALTLAGTVGQVLRRLRFR